MIRTIRVIVMGGTLALAGASLLACGERDEPSGPGPAPTLKPSESTEPDAAARRFLDRYVLDDGRVERIDEGGDTVGEGQAYGMLIAAAIGDEERFDAIWKWTKDNLERPEDGLIAFLWKDGEVVDPQAASDADVDAARALLVASCTFDRPELRTEAMKLGQAILDVQTAKYEGADVLTAGPWAVEEPITLNPSYFSPATFAALYDSFALDDEPDSGRWRDLSKTSYSVTEALMQEETPLPPDWARVEGGNLVPIGLPDQPDAPPKFSFDAFRTLVRMAEDPDPAGRRIAARAWPVFEGRDPADIPVEHDLAGEPVGGTKHPVALVAAAGAADAAGDDVARDRLLDAAQALDEQFPTYYGSAWVALGRIMLVTDDLDSCY
jgi:endoglucanase